MRRVPPNISKASKRDAERAQKQLARVSIALRRMAAKAKRNGGASDCHLAPHGRAKC
jgi:hypothetical protein